MIYGDELIRQLLGEGLVPIGEPGEGQINPASLNLRLGNTFLRQKKTPMGITLGDQVDYQRYAVADGSAFPLYPGEFILATTKEVLKMPESVAGFVQGRSSIGRIGLTTQNAGFIDPGFNGAITLELVNESPNTLFLKPGYPVAQVVFFDAAGVKRPYAGKYNGQIEATGSRMYQDVLEAEK